MRPTWNSAKRPGELTLPIPAKLRPRRTDVDVWRVSLDEPSDERVERFEELLSAGETERADRLYFARDRRRFVVGRAVLRLLVEAYTAIPAADVEFAYGENGKPRIVLPASDGGVEFNLAHSEGLAVYAFCGAGPVGIDVERIRELPDWECIAASCFSAPERHRLQTAEPSRRRDEFFRAWTRQEAVLKATGAGLGAAEEPSETGGAAGHGTFRIHPLNVAPGFAAALAVVPDVRWATFASYEASFRTDSGIAPLRAVRFPLNQRPPLAP